jgi:hypothetical protein
MKEAIWIVKVIEGDQVYVYEYGNVKHALEHYEDEIKKGNHATIIKDTDY